MFNDLVSDMINRINVSYSVNKSYVFIFYSKLIYNIFIILKNEGYILDFFKILNKKKNMFLVYLKYFNNKPVIQIFKKVSKLSSRIYRGYKTIPKIMNGLGISIISTNKGLMTDKLARNLGLGGEIICYVF
ncbi:30S ribosomal protein S8p (S15Ae) [Candidatus Nasuia deltocephalinicola]|nr:30S ribosomal protein S8p (S15Ae) [Candidatus Nasuia deltocephalinicola]